MSIIHIPELFTYLNCCGELLANEINRVHWSDQPSKLHQLPVGRLTEMHATHSSHGMIGMINIHAHPRSAVAAAATKSERGQNAASPVSSNQIFLAHLTKQRDARPLFSPMQVECARDKSSHLPVCASNKRWRTSRSSMVHVRCGKFRIIVVWLRFQQLQNIDCSACDKMG